MLRGAKVQLAGSNIISLGATFPRHNVVNRLKRSLNTLGAISESS